MAGFGPSDVGMVLQGIGALAQAIAIFAAAWFASNTFEGWRRQKLSERRIEQAERILTATYKVRRGLTYVRSASIWGHEEYAAQEKLKSDGLWPDAVDEQGRKTTQQVYYNRLQATRTDQKELDECKPMARALFGEPLELAIEELNRQFHLVRIYADEAAKHNGNARPQLLKKIRDALEEGDAGDDANEMDQRVAAQVRLIEDRLVPVLRLDTT